MAASMIDLAARNRQSSAIASASHYQIDRRSSHTPLKCLTGQAEARGNEARKAKRLATVSLRNVFSAASPHFLVAVWPNWLIVIGFGED
jgi:hypothetical protein